MAITLQNADVEAKEDGVYVNGVQVFAFASEPDPVVLYVKVRGGVPEVYLSQEAADAHKKMPRAEVRFTLDISAALSSATGWQHYAI